MQMKEEELKYYADVLRGMIKLCLQTLVLLKNSYHLLFLHTSYVIKVISYSNKLRKMMLILVGIFVNPIKADISVTVHSFTPLTFKKKSPVNSPEKLIRLFWWNFVYLIYGLR